MSIPSWKDVHDHAKEHPAGLWLVRPTGEMPVIIALEARGLSTVWGRCVASGTAWLPIGSWADDGATWRRCDDDGVPVDVSAERDDARAMLTKIEAVLPSLFSQRQKPLDVRVADLVANRDTWCEIANRVTREKNELGARIKVLETERVPGNEREFQARLDAMKEAESSTAPASPPECPHIEIPGCCGVPSDCWMDSGESEDHAIKDPWPEAIREMSATPWPLHDVIAKLVSAADHLLVGHDCDVHGWEEIGRARDKGRRLLARMGIECPAIPAHQKAKPGNDTTW